MYEKINLVLVIHIYIVFKFELWGLAFLNGVTFVDCEIEKEDEEDEEKEEGEHVMLLVRHQLR